MATIKRLPDLSICESSKLQDWDTGIACKVRSAYHFPNNKGTQCRSYWTLSLLLCGLVVRYEPQHLMRRIARLPCFCTTQLISQPYFDGCESKITGLYANFAHYINATEYYNILIPKIRDTICLIIRDISVQLINDKQLGRNKRKALNITQNIE